MRIITMFCCMLLAQQLFAQINRAPAYPLVTHDPYLSIWSSTDDLNASTTQHWTGTSHSLIGMLKVDGTTYRFLGKKENTYNNILPAGDYVNYKTKYTEKIPATDWMNSDFDDRDWKNGIAPFGNIEGVSKTMWLGRDIWMRREFYLDHLNLKEPLLKLQYDDDVQVYLNGNLIYEANCCAGKYLLLPMNDEMQKKLKQGKNVIAIHGLNTGGGALLDVGIVEKAIPIDENIVLAKQKSVKYNATQTIYEFECSKVNLTLTFTSPLLINDLSLLSRPVTYINTKVKSNDGAEHDVQLNFGVSTDIATNDQSQPVKAMQYDAYGLSILKAGTVEQPILKKRGDDLRIDWGYMYIAVAKNKTVKQSITPNDIAKGSTKKHLSLNTNINFYKTGSKEREQLFLISYDDNYSIQYFGKNLRPWWNQNGTTKFEQVLADAAKDYPVVIKKCEAINKRIYDDALNAGGEKYAQLCELSYRQSIAAHKLVKSPNGDLLFLSKENFSNGSINTVDVTYPSAPLFLAYNPDLLKGMLNGIFYYSESGKWSKPFAAHDLGTYPQANGQTYSEDMPVEECGNMLILVTAISTVEKNADYARKHWKTMTIWVKYLKENGLDPATQLCTDDFAGHLARNANLSIKAILAIAGYGKMAGMIGDKKTATEYTNLAKEYADRWMKMADVGNHYSLTFENKNSWSQKYNLVWDKLLHLNIFPDTVAQKEVQYYLTKQEKYGLPLDSRKTYTKSDWVLWTATLADNDADFQKLFNPIFSYVNETTSRVPISDWHETTNGRQVGFQARSVVGGYFIKLFGYRLNKMNGF